MKDVLSQTQREKLEIYDDNVFTICPQCGTEHCVDIQDVLASEGADLFGTAVYCKDCARKGNKKGRLSLPLIPLDRFIYGTVDEFVYTPVTIFISVGFYSVQLSLWLDPDKHFIISFVLIFFYAFITGFASHAFISFSCYVWAVNKKVSFPTIHNIA